MATGEMSSYGSYEWQLRVAATRNVEMFQEAWRHLKRRNCTEDAIHSKVQFMYRSAFEDDEAVECAFFLLKETTAMRLRRNSQRTPPMSPKSESVFEDTIKYDEGVNGTHSRP